MALASPAKAGVSLRSVRGLRLCNEAQRDVCAATGRKVDHAGMSASAQDTVSVLMADLVGSTLLADRVGRTAAEPLRTESWGLGLD